MKRYLAEIESSVLPPNISPLKDISDEEYLLYEQSKEVIDETKGVKEDENNCMYEAGA